MEKLNAETMLRMSEEAARDTLNVFGHESSLSDVLKSVFQMGALSEQHAQKHGFTLDFDMSPSVRDVFLATSKSQVHAAIEAHRLVNSAINEDLK